MIIKRWSGRVFGSKEFHRWRYTHKGWWLPIYQARERLRREGRLVNLIHAKGKTLWHMKKRSELNVPGV